MTPEAGNYVKLRDFLRNENTLKNAGGHVTGDLFELPAGSLAVAAGLEYSDYAVESVWDSLSNAGFGTASQQRDQAGSFDVFEAYVEALIPVTENFEIEGGIPCSEVRPADGGQTRAVGNSALLGRLFSL